MAEELTFGQALQRFRKKAGIGIFDLTVRMGWKGTGPIIELEKGKRLPRPATIDRLGEALNLTHSDICYLRGLAGYGPITRMPTKSQILTVLDTVVQIVADYRYPCYITDYRGMYWLFNPAETAFMEDSMDSLRDLMRNRVTIFDIVFDSRLGLRGRLVNQVETDYDQIFRFKAYNQYRRHEAFYRSYPECMKPRLLAKDYERFETAWNAVEVTLESNKLVFPFGGFLRPNGDVQVSVGEKHTFRFDRIEQPLLHLNGLFDLVYYRPTGSPEDIAECQTYFSQFSWTSEEFSKLWELVDIQSIIDQYDGPNGPEDKIAVADAAED